MFAATLKGLLSRKVRLALAGVAVVLGTMAVSASLVVTATISTSFADLFRTTNSGVDVQVSGQQQLVLGGRHGLPVTEPVPATVVAAVARVPGVASASGRVFEDGARVVGHDGRVIPSVGPPRFGESWPTGGDLVQLRGGRSPQRAGEIAVNGYLAGQAGLSLGDRVTVLTRAPARSFELVGIFGYRGARDSLSGETAVAFDESTAQLLMLGRTGVYSAIDVRAAAGVSAEQLRASVQAALGPAYRVRTSAQVAADQTAVIDAFVAILRSVLLGFAGVALFVGSFLIFNTFSILIAQRTHELALLRVLGATRGQVVRSVLLEAAATGLVASTLGLLAGLGIAALMKLAVTARSGAQLAPGLVVPGSAVLAAYLVGCLVTVLAGLLPALHASRVRPVAALREAAGPERPLRALTVAGVELTALGVSLLGYRLSGRSGEGLPLLLAGVLLSFLGAVLLTPALSRLLVPVVGRLFSWSVAGTIGWRNSARSPRRTAVTAGALLVGIALVSGVSVVATSLKSSILDAARGSLSADLVIAGDSGSRTVATFEPAVVDQAARQPGVRSAVALYTDVGQLGDGRFTRLSAGDLPALAAVFSLHASAGALPALRPGQVAVDADFADTRGLRIGDPLRLTTQRGTPGTFTVVSVFARSDLLSGIVLAPADAVARFRSPQPSQGLVMLAAGADPHRVAAELSALVAADPEITVSDRSDYLRQQTGQVDTVLAVLFGLLGLTLLIAVLGIVNTLALSIVERRREIGLLRAVGMRRRQATGMVVAESMTTSLFGALLGLAVGCALGAAVSRSLAGRGITELTLPWASVGRMLAVVVVAGLVAAAVPALHTARIDVLRAIGYD